MALAKLTPSVIINADSMQVYRDLRVVTARPSAAEEAKAPHRLFGYIDGAEACSAARWAADAKVAITEAHDAGRLPILVGGTGLYMRTLLDGIAPVPEIDPVVRAEVRAMTVADAYVALRAEDAAAATRLAPADAARVMRALEVVRSTDKPLADWQDARMGGIDDQVRLVPMILLPARDWLSARCDARFDMMFEQGQDEVAELIARGLDAALPVMRAIGVPEIMAYQCQKLVKSESKASGKLATRQYAKRQYTWFRRQLPEDWPRHTESLNNESINKLAILLRSKALTP
jgi:tRNA dimethylallyltransferase